jgi:hypothetical protein
MKSSVLHFRGEDDMQGIVVWDSRTDVGERLASFRGCWTTCTRYRYLYPCSTYYHSNTVLYICTDSLTTQYSKYSTWYKYQVEYNATQAYPTAIRTGTIVLQYLVLHRFLPEYSTIDIHECSCI